MKNRERLVAVLLLVVTTAALAQYGSAPPGYYPLGYSGDTFTGKVASVDDTAQTISVLFDNGKKTQNFTGVFDKPCSVPTKNGEPLKPSDISVGTDLTVFFMEKTQKVSGQKVKENHIIGLTFNSYNGQPIPENKRHLYSCASK